MAKGTELALRTLGGEKTKLLTLNKAYLFIFTKCPYSDRRVVGVLGLLKRISEVEGDLRRPGTGFRRPGVA
jgi:hypothetical protein